MPSCQRFSRPIRLSHGRQMAWTISTNIEEIYCHATRIRCHHLLIYRRPIETHLLPLSYLTEIERLQRQKPQHISRRSPLVAGAVYSSGVHDTHGLTHLLLPPPTASANTSEICLSSPPRPPTPPSLHLLPPPPSRHTSLLHTSRQVGVR